MSLSFLKKMFRPLRIKIALRSITRHRLRSSLSIAMIAGAVCAIVIFHGLSDFMLESIKEIAAENQYGNMQIAKDKYWNPGKENRKERLFQLEELNPFLKQHPEIIKSSGRLAFYGLISNGDLSVGAKVIGIDIEKETTFTKSIRIMDGKFFTKNDVKEGMIGHLLAKQMRVTTGDEITILGVTVDGQMNAMDLIVSGTFTVGIDEVDSQVIYMPLTTTQSILDTSSVDLGVLQFSHLPLAEAKEKSINAELAAAKTSLVARSWRTLATLYRQVEKFYNVQNRLIEGILLALMFLGILNAVTMTVVERTGEIGTLRSFGETRGDIIGQFVLESLILSLAGIVLGTLTSWGIVQITEAVGIVTELPNVSVPVEIHINFLWSAVLYASGLALSTAIIATYLPARRAVHMNIVDALRKNI
jgi:putative ABC transport system permease protein